MNRKLFKGASVLASAAALSMAATPALARDRWGWGGGWGRHHDRVDAGDVLAGILIIGGIAAVASAASKAGKNKSRSNDDYRYPEDRDYRGDDYRGNDYRETAPREGYGTAYAGDMNDAVNRCIDEVNRGRARVEGVDGAERDADGWRVRGRVGNDSRFSCTIDGDGRIRQVSIDGQAA